MFNHAVSSCRILGLFTVLASFTVPVVAATDARVVESYGRLPLHFEANQGQTQKDVQFLARGPNYGLYLTAGEMVLVLARPSQNARAEAKPVALHMSLVGAACKPLASGREELVEDDRGSDAGCHGGTSGIVLQITNSSTNSLTGVASRRF